MRQNETTRLDALWPKSEKDFGVQENCDDASLRLVRERFCWLSAGATAGVACAKGRVRLPSNAACV